MIETVTKDTIREYEVFVQAHPQGRFPQSSLWGKQKPQWRWRGLMRRDDRGGICGTLALLTRRVPVLPSTIVYGCRGPVCSAEDRETLAELLRAAVEIGRRERAYVVRLDPVVSPDDRAFLELAAECGFTVRKHRRFYRPMQSNRLWRVPLSCGAPERVPAAFDEQTRQSVRIALQRGVTVRQGGRELAAQYAELLSQTAVREGRVVRPMEYYAGLLENFGSSARIHLAVYEGRPVAGALVLTYGGRAVCVSSADDGDITLRARFLLRTMILRQAVEDGCACCDFPGLPESPEESEYLFAAGFGGEAVAYVGELDYVLRPAVNFLAETAGVLWRFLQKRWYFFQNR